MPTPALVDSGVEEAEKTICDYLMNDNNSVVVIGVYGMGGVWNTMIVEHIHN